MSENTLKTCSKIDNLGIKYVWYNSKNKYWYCLFEGKPKAIHRILAEKYIPNTGNLGDVHHIDGDRENNRLENLMWCSRSDNLKWSYKYHGRVGPSKGKFDDKHHNSIPVKSVCPQSGETITYKSLHDAGRSGYQVSKISLCINGKRNTHGGLKWEKCFEGD